MKRRLGILAVLSILTALITPAAASADAHDFVAVSADENETEIIIGLTTPSWSSIEGRVNADAAGEPDVVTDTQVATFRLSSSESQAEVFVESLGSAPDRWVDGFALGEPNFVAIHLTAGTEPFSCGDTIAQIYLVIDESTVVDLRDVPTQSCPADVDPVLGDSGYLFDSSVDRFNFTGQTSSFLPGLVNRGPADESNVSFDFRIDYSGVADDPLLGTDFTWTLESDCSTFGVTPPAPTAICRDLGPLLAGDTLTRSVMVDWLLPGDYFTVTSLPFDEDLSTPDPDPTPQSLSYVIHVLDPADDHDSDLIANAVDREAAVWEPLTPSSAFDDSYWGGTTSGTVTSGDVTVTDHPADGVSITATTAATVDACTQTLSLASGTTATITCGSITVAVDSGLVEVTLVDGSTLALASGDEATVDDGAVTVISGSATITPDGGDPIEIEEGTTYVIGGDGDLDGVLDVDDVCPGTVTEDLETFDLKPKRYYLNAGFAFVDGDAQPVLDDSGAEITAVTTGGCSASQIIEAADLGKGHERFGISRSALLDWVAGLSG